MSTRSSSGASAAPARTSASSPPSNSASSPLGRVSYLELQAGNDAPMAWGGRSYIDGGFTDGLRPETLDALVEHVAGAPGEANVGLAGFGGAVGRVPDEATAFPSRSAM